MKTLLLSMYTSLNFNKVELSQGFLNCDSEISKSYLHGICQFTKQFHVYNLIWISKLCFGDVGIISIL